MNVREKLIEILQDENNPIWRGLPDNISISTMQLADHLINNGVTVQEWISVNDRLPEPFESVLVLRDGKISIDYNEGNGWFAYDFNGKRVTHWMQLPQPPKGEWLKMFAIL